MHKMEVQRASLLCCGPITSRGNLWRHSLGCQEKSNIYQMAHLCSIPRPLLQTIHVSKRGLCTAQYSWIPVCPHWHCSWSWVCRHKTRKIACKRLRQTTFFSVSQNNALEFSKCQMIEQTCGIWWLMKKLVSRSRILSHYSKKMCLPGEWREFCDF